MSFLFDDFTKILVMGKKFMLFLIITVLICGFLFFERSPLMGQRGCTLNVTLFCQRGYEDLCNEVKRNVTLVLNEFNVKFDLSEEWSNYSYVILSTKINDTTVVVEKRYVIEVNGKSLYSADTHQIESLVKELCEK